MRLRVTKHLALKLHIVAHHYCAIGWQASLKDWPVGRTLCTTERSRNVNDL